MRTLDALAEASGLAPIFAKNAIRRAAERCNVNLEHVAPADLDRLVEELRRVVTVFEPSEAEAATARMRAVLRRHA